MSGIGSTMWPEKVVEERVTAEFDFGPELQIGETVVSVVWVVTTVKGVDASPQSVLYGAPVIQGTRVYQQLWAGLAGCSYRVQCRATTQIGDVLILQGVLPVVSAELAGRLSTGLVTIPVLVTAVRPDGTLVTGARVRAVITVPEVDGDLVVRATVEDITDAGGSVTLALWPNSRGVNSSQYRILIDEVGYSVLITVPEAPVSAWPLHVHTLINQAPYPPLSASQQALTALQAALAQLAGSQIDGGTPGSVYGGTTAINGGTP